MKNLEEMKGVIKDGNLDTVVNKIKESPSYKIYEHAVRDKQCDNTSMLLQILTMLSATSNDELSVLITSVSMDLMFAMIDAKLRNEILSTRGVE